MKNAEIKNSFRFRTELRTGNAAAEILMNVKGFLCKNLFRKK